MASTDVRLDEINTQMLASDLAGQTDITKLETTLLDVTLLDPYSAAETLGHLAENPSEAAARLAHRIFTVYETTLIKAYLKQHNVEGIAQERSDLTLAEARLPYEGGTPTDRLSRLSGKTEKLRQALSAKSIQPASMLSAESLKAYETLCGKLQAFIDRQGVDRILFTTNIENLTSANPQLKRPTLGLGMEIVKNWRGQAPTIPGNTIDLGALTSQLGKSLTQPSVV